MSFSIVLLEEVILPTVQLAATSVTARIRPEVTELSPPFIEFCTALLSTISKTRSKGLICPICRLLVALSRRIRKK